MKIRWAKSEKLTSGEVIFVISKKTGVKSSENRENIYDTQPIISISTETRFCVYASCPSHVIASSENRNRQATNDNKEERTREDRLTRGPSKR